MDYLSLAYRMKKRFEGYADGYTCKLFRHRATGLEATAFELTALQEWDVQFGSEIPVTVPFSKEGLFKTFEELGFDYIRDVV